MLVAQPETEFRLRLTPNQKSFCFSTADIVALIGPMGEGKTYAGMARALIKAGQVDHKLKGALIRDNGTNIEDHTIPSLERGFGEILDIRKIRQGAWRVRARENLEMIMFGLDSLHDLSKLQGPEWDFLWLEEPAPVIDTTTAGLREEVFEIGNARLGRDKKGVWLQITMNPADELHWTTKYLIDSPLPDLVTEVFYIASGENPFLDDAYRRRVASSFANRPDLYSRYVLGKTGSVQVGEAVTPEYREEIHRSKTVLMPIPNLQIMRLWDGWHNPCCIFAQSTPSGRVLVLDTVQGINMGVKQLITTRIKPLIGDKYRNVPRWRDIGDETMRTADQSDKETTAAGVIETELKCDFEGCSNDWNPRRESLRTLLTTGIDDGRMLLISPHEGILHRALRGGWHYPKSPTGVVGDRPVKDIHSHPGDAASYGAVKILPSINTSVPVIPRMMKRALSYCVGAR